MAGGMFLTCPRCRLSRQFVSVGLTWRCLGCEWVWALTAQAPTGTATAAVTTASTAITVASGGASFTAGMQLLYDTGSNVEIVTVGGGATATSIPVAAFTRNHAAVTFGQLAVAAAFPSLDVVPPLPGWGF
jgi:hypothetical protein